MRDLGQSKDSTIDVIVTDNYDTDDDDAVVAAAANEPPLKQMQRTSSRFFENKNTKQLRKLERKTLNTRAQIAQMVLSPGKRLTSQTQPPVSASYNTVMAELAQKKRPSSQAKTYESDSSSANSIGSVGPGPGPSPSPLPNRNIDEDAM
jgi:hypothetical protein